MLTAALTEKQNLTSLSLWKSGWWLLGTESCSRRGVMAAVFTPGPTCQIGQFLSHWGVWGGLQGQTETPNSSIISATCVVGLHLKHICGKSKCKISSVHPAVSHRRAKIRRLRAANKSSGNRRYVCYRWDVLEVARTTHIPGLSPDRDIFGSKMMPKWKCKCKSLQPNCYFNVLYKMYCQSVYY